MLSDLLKTLSFGATIQSGGKPYNVIIRLSDRLFVAIDPTCKLPAPLMLCLADIQMNKAVQKPGSVAGEGPVPTGEGPKANPIPPPDKDEAPKKENLKVNPGRKELPPENDSKKEDTVH